MNDTVQIRAGTKARLPALAQREFGYCTDTRELYIGTAAGNVRLAEAGLFDEVSGIKSTCTGLAADIAGLQSTCTSLRSDMDVKLTATSAASVAPLAAEAELAAAVTKVNELISALRAAGIMKGGSV